jgi:hypothetical protein
MTGLQDKSDISSCITPTPPHLTVVLGVSDLKHFRSHWTQDAVFCEYGNEPLGSIKDGEFLEQLNAVLPSQEALSSTEFVLYLGTIQQRTTDFNE